jgi:hypothetical protein
MFFLSRADFAGKAWLASILLTLSGCASAEQVPSAPTFSDQQLHAFAIIQRNQVASPLGKFILVRSGQEACAVKFLAFSRGGDARVPSFFSSGEETIDATYESYHQGDGSFDMTKANVVRTLGKVSDKASVGLGRAFSLKRGADWGVKCGKTKVSWHFPHFLSYWTRAEEDREYRWQGAMDLAPSAVDDVRKVDFRDSHVTWYRGGVIPLTESVFVPMNELTK